MESNTKAFFELLRAGLWADVESTDFVNLGFTEPVDWNKIYQLAEEQSVVGLVLAGIERLKNTNLHLGIDQEMLLQMIGEVQMLEQQNKAMNEFIAKLVGDMREADIYTLLVKGQGVAQCYEKPLWRSCGDVDFLLSSDNYNKAKAFLTPMASNVLEDAKMMHIEMTIDQWMVELHGSMKTELFWSINKGIHAVQKDLFYGGNVRSWVNGGTTVFLPSWDNDVILVFTHILQHFFIEGIGLKQACDWCRLLYRYRKELDVQLLEQRVNKMGLLRVWKAFAAMAVDYLGMPKEAMPFYDSRFVNKGERVLKRILKSGNMGYNNDLSYRDNYSGFSYRIVALWRRFADFVSLAPAFSVDAPRFFLHYVFRKI